MHQQYLFIILPIRCFLVLKSSLARTMNMGCYISSKKGDIIMEDFDITENCKTKDFIRFIIAISAGVFFACASVVFLGLISL